LDGLVGLVVGRFEFAVGAVRWVGLVVKPAVESWKVVRTASWICLAVQPPMRAVEDQGNRVASSDFDEGFDLFNADRDARLMVPAREWFGRADAKAVTLHHDPHLQRFEKYMLALAPVLPVLVPPDDGGDKSFEIPGDIWNHAQELIRRR